MGKISQVISFSVIFKLSKKLGRFKESYCKYLRKKHEENGF